MALSLDQVRMGSEVLLNIEEYEDSFAKETAVISEAMCILANEGSLNDYRCSAGYVSVLGDGDNYYLYLDELVFEIFVKDRMIIDYNVS